MTLALGNHESKLVAMGRLREPANPSRTSFDEQRLAELSQNILERGVLQHLIVVPDGDTFEIIAGHRRYFAARRAGLVVVPCDVYPNRADADEAVQHAENRHREELTASDEAIWFDDLLERKFDGDVDRLCAYLGEKRGYVEGRLNLFRGDERVFEALARKQITIGVAEQLNRCDDELHRRMLLHQAIENGATVAIMSGWVADYFRIHKPALPVVDTSAPASVPQAVPQLQYFRCVLCGKTDHVEAMQPRNFHTYCEQAMFAEMLERYERRHEFFRYPRTLDEAAALVADLAERFPMLGQENDPRRV